MYKNSQQKIFNVYSSKNYKKLFEIFLFEFWKVKRLEFGPSPCVLHGVVEQYGCYGHRCN